MQHIDTSRHGQRPERRGSDAAGLHGLAGAVAGNRLVQHGNGGTEYFLSSNAADEATHPVAGSSGTRLEPTRRLDADEHVVAELGAPALGLSTKVLGVNKYGSRRSNSSRARVLPLTCRFRRATA